MIYWRWCQQPFTLAVTADESEWGITIHSAVVIRKLLLLVVVKIDGVSGVVLNKCSG